MLFDQTGVSVVQEDHIHQNPMTSITEIKDGWFRRTTLKGVFAAVDFLAHYYFVRGNLGGIPSIHFAAQNISAANEKGLKLKRTCYTVHF